VKPVLLDVNVLVALAWPNHTCHAQAHKWFAEVGRFATCPVTQMGFVRVSSNPIATPTGVTVVEALNVLASVLLMPNHEFWPDELRVTALQEFSPPLVGHRQVTDAYLLKLAQKHGAKVATLDRGLLTLAKSSGLGANALSV
jgi:uncharacterized protein